MMTTRMIAGLLGIVVELILTSSYVVDQLLKTEHGIPQTQIHTSDGQSPQASQRYHERKHINFQHSFC